MVPVPDASDDVTAVDEVAVILRLQMSVWKGQKGLLIAYIFEGPI